MAVKAAGRAPAQAKASGADWRLLSVTAVLYGAMVSDLMHGTAHARRHVLPSCCRYRRCLPPPAAACCLT